MFSKWFSSAQIHKRLGKSNNNNNIGSDNNSNNVNINVNINKQPQQQQQQHDSILRSSNLLKILGILLFICIFIMYSPLYYIAQAIGSRLIHHYLASIIHFVKFTMLYDERSVFPSKSCSFHGWKDRKKPVTIYSGFTFHNEFNMLDLRLGELDDIVDYFIIVETATTFSSHPKPLLFWENRKKYSKWLDRIIHVVVNDTESTDPWKRQADARSAIVIGLDQANAKPDDLVILSDADEIPRGDIIKLLKSCEGYGVPVSFHMPEYYYDFGCEDEHSHWNRVKMLRRDQLIQRCSDKELKNMLGQWAVCPDLTRTDNPTSLEKRLHVKHGLRINDAGWHMSFFMDFERIVEKLGAYAHTERAMSNSEKNKKHLECLIEKCIHVNENSHGTRVDPYTVRTPKYALDQSRASDKEWSRYYKKFNNVGSNFFGCPK